MFIHAEVDAGRGFPSHEEIKAHMGWTAFSNVSEALMSLSGAGYITRWHERGKRNRWQFGLIEGTEKQLRSARA